MKKLLYIFAMLLLTGCGKFSDGQSVWAGGVWIIPILLFSAAGFFLYIAIKKSKSGSEQQTSRGIKSYDENVPVYKIGQFWFAIGFIVAAIIVIIIQNGEK